jgi:glycerol uptake facilitator-like aquaporin
LLTYTKLFSALAGGGITLVSARNKLELSAELLRHLIVALVYLAAILALVATAQIVFCLARWWGYRKAERRIHCGSPEEKWWWWVFETLYILAMWAMVAGAWRFETQLVPLLGRRP